MNRICQLVLLATIAAAAAAIEASIELSELSELRDMMLTPSAQELLQRAESTFWNRELRAASEEVERRRRRRRRRKVQNNVMGSSKQNGYMPESAPDSLYVSPEEETSVCLSPLQRWFVSMIEGLGMETWEQIQAYNVTSVAYLYKHYVSSSDGTDEYFGTYGERTEEMKKNHEKLQEFWSHTADDGKYFYAASKPSPFDSLGLPGSSHSVILLGMHGVDLADDAKMVPTLQQIYHMSMEKAATMASLIQNIVMKLPGAFNNPILTSNAIAIQSSIPGNGMHQRDSVVIGDGVFEFLDWLQLGPDGPDYIHSHEFGHHIQYDLGVHKIGGSWTRADETRRYELMADSFGAYFLAHAEGGRLDAERLYEVHRAAFSLGDCEDAAESHHGTPRQRECASNYGANLALPSYIDGGHIMARADLREMFDDKLMSILDLDEDMCEPIVDASVLDSNIYGEDVVKQHQNQNQKKPSNSPPASNPTPANDALPTTNQPPPQTENKAPHNNSPKGKGNAQVQQQSQPTTISEADYEHDHTQMEQTASTENDPSNNDEGWFGEGSPWLKTRGTGMNSSSRGRSILCSQLTLLVLTIFAAFNYT